MLGAPKKNAVTWTALDVAGVLMVEAGGIEPPEFKGYRVKTWGYRTRETALNRVISHQISH